MPGLTRHPYDLQGIAGQARNDGEFNVQEVYTKFETVSSETVLGRVNIDILNTIYYIIYINLQGNGVR